MPIDPVKRAENYARKTTPSRTAGIVTTRVKSMKENAGVTFNSMVAMETQVRQVINGAGATTIQYPFYLCFGRELWSLNRRGISGEALSLEAAILIAKWTAQGLTTAVLQAIRTDVFNVAAPVAP
jgi:hypothetical protein